MTEKKLIKHGKSYALVIPRAIMEQLGIEPDTLLKISADSRGIRVVPVRDEVPDYELIRERRRFHVSLLRTLLPKPAKKDGSFSEEQKDKIKQLARKNIHADPAEFSNFEQSVILEQVIDEILYFGPLTPFLNDVSINKIFTSFDYTFWTDGTKLPILFDSEEHADTILKSVQRVPHGPPDDDGWVIFAINSCKLFVPAMLLSD
ncbi:MAG TPA: AbrB/MazE/SpoVT family DNA-binding domain-containing protein [Oculatellaceae cyanobacterium]